MGQSRFGGWANSIQRKVIIGFSIIILILLVVSFISINGIRRLSHVFDNTEMVNRLQDQVSDLRLNEKRVVLSADSSLLISVDSITRAINQQLVSINSTDINSDSKEELAQMNDLLIKVLHLTPAHEHLQHYLKPT